MQKYIILLDEYGLLIFYVIGKVITFKAWTGP